MTESTSGPPTTGPDELLSQVREAITSWHAAAPGGRASFTAGSDLATAFTKLDHHLSSGGQPPAGWARKPSGVTVVRCGGIASGSPRTADGR